MKQHDNSSQMPASASQSPSGTPQPATAFSGNALRGFCTAPGDKSISHRSIIFGALAEGLTQVRGLLDGADIHSTIGAMKSLGADITQTGDIWHIEGVGEAGLISPDHNIDCGNAGTGVRLIMGAAAAYPLEATFTGDASLTSRPMGRVTDPLNLMGIETQSHNDDQKLPITLRSKGRPKAIDYTPPHASAQVKSAILLAGLRARGTTIVREPRPSRDHTENMLKSFGARIETEKDGVSRIVRLKGPARLKGCRIDVPGDPSSAAFMIVAALITPGSAITVKNVMMNPTRTGLFETLVEMGADIRAKNFRQSGGEVICDIDVRYSPLVGVDVPAERAPSMIDEYPILAVAAAFADGVTHMPGLAELRVKESDRIAATESLLNLNGVKTESGPAHLSVVGNPAHVKGGGFVKTHHDHRIGMSALVLGLAAKNPVTIDDASMIATSFPNFFTLLQNLGASFDRHGADEG